MSLETPTRFFSAIRDGVGPRMRRPPDEIHDSRQMLHKITLHQWRMEASESANRCAKCFRSRKLWDPYLGRVFNFIELMDSIHNCLLLYTIVEVIFIV